MTSTLADVKMRLGDESPEVRRRAVLDIARLQPEEALDVVISALGDEDWRVRKQATSVAATFGSDGQFIARLIDEMVQEDNIGLRNAAAEALSAAGSEAIGTIIDRIPTLDASGRKIAIEVLGATSDPRVVDVLVGLLNDEDHNVRACAAEWLGEQGGEAAIKALSDCLKSSDRLLVLAALQSLNRVGAKLSWKKLEPISNEKLYGPELILAMGYSGAREAAGKIAQSLAEDPAACRAMEILHNYSDDNAAEVERVLKQIDEAAFEYLAQWVRNGEPAEQRAAASCILWSRPIEQMTMIAVLARNETLYPLLLKELDAWGPPAKRGLELMLGDLQGVELASVIGLLSRLFDEEEGRTKIELFSKYLEADDVAIVTSAVAAIARFGDVEKVDRLLDLSRAPDERLSRVAGQAIIEIGRRYPKEVREKVIDLEIEGKRGIHLCRVLEVVGLEEDALRLSTALNSPDPELRAAVLGVLAAIAGRTAVETIALSMTDEAREVRMAAAAALGRIGPAAAETIVSALHTADDGPVRPALIRALGRVGHPEAATILLSMCKGPAEVALAALEAMRELGMDGSDIHGEILAHPDREVVKQALSVLGTTVDAAQLVQLLDNPDWDVRLAAVDRLSLKIDATNVDEEQVREALREHLKKEKDDLVIGAIERVLSAKGVVG